MSSQHSEHRNVTEAQMLDYLGTFTQEYRRFAQSQLREEYRPGLRLWPLLDRRVVGYVSTKFGAGFEFFPDQGPTQIKRSSDRIERLWLGAPATVLRRVGDTALFEIEGGNIRVVRAGFREALPFWLEAPDSYITLDRCSVKLGPFERQVEYGQFHADRSSDYWSEAEAVRRAADDCLIAAADINQADALNRNLFETLARFRETRVWFWETSPPSIVRA